MEDPAIEWRIFIKPQHVPSELTALKHVLTDMEDRTDVYLPASEAVGVKRRKETKLELKRRTHLSKHDMIAGPFEGYVKVKMGKSENIDAVRAYLKEHNEYTPETEAHLTSAMNVVVAKKVRKGTPMDHPALTIETSDLNVRCEKAAVVPETAATPLTTFSVEGPRSAVQEFIQETTAGAALDALARHAEAIVGGYPTLVMRLVEADRADAAATAAAAARVLPRALSPP